MENNKIAGGIVWTFLERISAQLVSALVTIILARLLSPEHYGIISIITVFISFCNVFVTSGFGSSVVRKKNATDDDYDTAFFISFLISIVLYILLFITAPFIADFYNSPILKPITRVMAIRIILASFNSIQQAHIQKKLQFKKFFISTLLGTCISAIVGIYMAYKGFGAWALVFQYLTNTIIDSIVLVIVDKWKPRLRFHIENAKYIFSFGWKVLVTDLIFTIEGDLRSLFIGKVFGADDLAYYDQGKKYPNILVTNINSSLNKVMLPAYSEKQDNLVELKKLLRKTIRIGLFIIVPILIGFLLVSKEFVLVILTEKWTNSIPYIQIFCLMYLSRPLEVLCHQALLSLGKSGTVLILMGIVSGFGLFTTIIAVFVFRNVLYIALGLLITQVISYLCFMGASRKYINYTFKEQFSDVIKVLLACVVMAICVLTINIFNVNTIYSLILKIIIGVVTYVVSSFVLKNDSLIYFIEKLKMYTHKKSV